ncbi:MAG: hypothetical protein ACRD1S_01770 [Vicinamibacterales bacterium]
MKRLRGILLRTAYTRPVAVAIGAALVAPAALVWLRDFAWESTLTDGLALISGATGVAFIIAGFQRRRGDWIE